MKIRNGFVTNSSSSSFILAFKDKNDFRQFEQKCDEYGYEKVAALAKHRIKNNEKNIEEQKKEALENLYLWTTIDEKNAYMGKMLSYDVPYTERLKKEKEIEDSEEYKEHMKQFIEKTDYEQQRKMIEDAGLLVDTTIWDSNGGLLEFAIRNGLLKEWVFNDWFVSQIDIG